MPSRPKNAEERDHRPARSGTPSAWMALTLLSLAVLGIFFFNGIVCEVLRLGLATIAWSKRVDLSIDHLSLQEHGVIQAQGVALSLGPQTHRSSWKSDWVTVQLPTLGTLLKLAENKQPHLIRQIALGKTKLVIDHRTETQEAEASLLETKNASSLHQQPRIEYSIPWIRLLPDAVSVGPLDLVIVGNNARLAMSNLFLSLPDRWTGRVAYSEAVLDLGSEHHVFGATSAPAHWNGTTLQFGSLILDKELRLEELTFTPQRGRIDFGLRGAIGGGLLRGDGSFGEVDNHSSLAVTLVGENLKMDAISQLLKKDEHRASGTIRQGRITFRGNPDQPLESDSSLRFVADDFRWEGRGWDSLRVAATLTGRVCRLSELRLRQQGNEVDAQGESKLPEDWHNALKAPFTASFHADLDDAGALAALAGNDFAKLSGSLELEGAIKGAENKAEGYCNITSTGMKIRQLPLDWLKGCLLFEGNKTRLSNLEAWSGKDRIVMDGVVENNTPHTYAAKASFSVENLTKSLALLGISTASQIGGGAVQGIWSGDGSLNGHSGTFQAKLHDWISPWTMAGMSGSFEGSYSPGRLYCSKADFQSQDLRLGLVFSASPKSVEVKSIIATRKGKSDPLLQGAVDLPLNAPMLWQTGDLISTLGMKDPINLELELKGIKIEELATLLGQRTPFSGMLDGTLSASGTPETPKIHSKLKIANLTLPDAATTIGVNWAMDSGDGRASYQLIQEPAHSSPLTLQGDIPFSFVADNGSLRFSNDAAPIHGVITLHTIPTTGWLALLGSYPWVLREGTLDGSLILGGTLALPSIEGNLLLAAREAGLPGLPLLSAVKLPLVCSLTQARLTTGTALVGSNTVSLAGTLDWSKQPLAAQLNLTGKNIIMPFFAGLESRGDAELALMVQGTAEPTLNGTLLVKQVAGIFPERAIPFFTPPGIGENIAYILHSTPPSAASVQLNLEAKTDGSLPLHRSKGEETAQLQADLHLVGKVNALRWSGIIVAHNTLMELPCGSFVAPEVKLQSDGKGGEQLFFDAFGLTRLGLCMLQQDGLTQKLSMTPLAPPSAENTVADWVLALATPNQQLLRVPFLQLPAWLRQNTLFPRPTLGWNGETDSDTFSTGLGFYGRSWSMSFQQTQPKN